MYRRYARPDDFGLRWQSEAATPLFDSINALNRNHAVQTQESHAKSAKDAKVLDQPLVEITDQMVSKQLVVELRFCFSSAAFAPFA